MAEEIAYRFFMTEQAVEQKLKSLGVPKRDHLQFYKRTASGSGFLVDLVAAEKWLDKLRAEGRERVHPYYKKADGKVSISHTINTMLAEGCSNSEIWEFIKKEYDLPNSKKGYVTFIRYKQRLRDAKLAKKGSS
jgi:hypothetical protein